MSNQLSAFLGVFRYEFLMQVRRRALWITFTVVFLLFSLFFVASDILKDVPAFLAQTSLVTVIVFWTLYINTYLPICVGVLLADRLPRDHRIKVDELLTTTSVGLNVRLLGKYLGAMTATLMPMVLFYIIGAVYITVLSQNIMTIPIAVVTFLAIVIPGMLFISAFSIACPAVIKVPIYQFLFIGYWLWGNIFWFRPEIPTLGRTIIAPIGIFMAFGLFGHAGFDTRGLHITPALGLASIAVLVGTALLVMLALTRYLQWQQARQ